LTPIANTWDLWGLRKQAAIPLAHSRLNWIVDKIPVGNFTKVLFTHQDEVIILLSESPVYLLTW
jgi:hypothetical protein